MMNQKKTKKWTEEDQRNYWLTNLSELLSSTKKKLSWKKRKSDRFFNTMARTIKTKD